jgi:hypothetical protein
LDKEPRKATDVLLDIEKKLDIALNIIRTQDLSIKILSNKLNGVLEALEKQSKEPPKITVEAVNTMRPPPNPFQDPAKQIMVSSEFNLPLEETPKGFRRTSRPETFAGDNAYLNKQGPVDPKFPVQIPKAPPGRDPQRPPPGREAEVVVAPPAPKPKAPTNVRQQPAGGPQSSIPVMQRVVNAQGKSLFLADVEIIDLASMQPVPSTVKIRTNGTGKWMTSLGVGNYRVIIRKLEPANKQRLEATQDIQVDGSVSPLELQTIIIK